MKIEITADDTAWQTREWRPEVNGWSGDIVVFYSALARALPAPALVVEVGVYHGRSLLFLAERLRANRARDPRMTRLFGIDPSEWDPRDYPTLLRNLAAAPPEELYVVHALRTTSTRAARMFDDRSLDMVFIDAEHTESSVLEDLDAWRPKVKPEGVLSGHDFGGADPGVEKAVRRHFSNEELHHYDSVWWVENPGRRR